MHSQNVGELKTNALPDFSIFYKEDPVIFSNNSVCAECKNKIKDHDLVMAYKCSKALEIKNKWLLQIT